MSYKIFDNHLVAICKNQNLINTKQACIDWNVYFRTE